MTSAKLNRNQQKDLCEMYGTSGMTLRWSESSKSEMQAMRRAGLVEWGLWKAGQPRYWRLTDEGEKVAYSILVQKGIIDG